jgi:C-terminal processing protease CtpA/Prc
METKLHALHAVQKQINEFGVNKDEETKDAVMTDIRPRTHPKTTKFEEEEEKKAPKETNKEWIPFLWVGTVSEGSPALEAGLKEGDVIVKFEEVTHENPEGLNAVAQIVRSSENLTLHVKVVRKIEEKGVIFDFKLIPKTWSGQGTLG